MGLRQKTISFADLHDGRKIHGATASVYLLWACLFCSQLVGAPQHDNSLGGSQRPAGEAEPAMAPCPANPQRLADFANGDAYDYENLVSFLNTESCMRSAAAIGRDAIRRGVSFVEKPPFRLDIFAPGTLNQDVNAREQSDASLQERIPRLLRQSPLPSGELLPLAGQLALLSPAASRAALVSLAREQLQMAAPLIGRKDSQSQVAAKNVATSLLKLGIDRELMSEQFARSVEELAVLSQADSLSKIFQALGAAAQANRALAPTYNASAAALNAGLKKSTKVASNEDRDAMVKAVFAATQSALGAEDLFRPALADLNDAMLSLVEGKSLSEISLRLAYLEVLEVLAQSNSQTILAEALSLSLTPEVIFLPSDHRNLLALAARNYREIGIALQDNYLTAFHTLWSNYQAKKINKDYFMNARQQFLLPWTELMMDLGPAALTRRWLKQVVQYRLLPDTVMESRFPSLILEQLRRSEEASAQARAENAVEVRAASLAENMASLWTLQRIHVPALTELMERQQGQVE